MLIRLKFELKLKLKYIVELNFINLDSVRVQIKFQSSILNATQFDKQPSPTTLYSLELFDKSLNFVNSVVCSYEDCYFKAWIKYAVWNNRNSAINRKNNCFHQIESPLNLTKYAWDLWKKDSTLDPTLQKSCFNQQLHRCIHVAFL